MVEYYHMAQPHKSKIGGFALKHVREGKEKEREKSSQSSNQEERRAGFALLTYTRENS